MSDQTTPRDLDAKVEEARRQLANYLYEDGATSNVPLWSAFESAIAARACAPLVTVMEKVAAGLASGYGYKISNREQMVNELRTALTHHRAAGETTR